MLKVAWTVRNAVNCWGKIMIIEIVDNSNFREDELDHPVLNLGDSICWIYGEDREYWEQLNKEGYDETWDQFKNQICARGLVIPRPDWEFRGGEIDPQDAIICVYDYNVEKCYPETCYITFSSISENAEVYECWN